MKICPVCQNKYEDSLSFCPRDSEVLQEDRECYVGKVLDGQYKIEAFIAEGGMGAVYKAQHTMLGDKVAIKFLPPEMRRSTEWLRRFQREGQAARRFRHPNAVAVHDLRMSNDGDVYLVMEFVDGRTLESIVASHGGRLLPTASIKIIEQVANVLDAAHQTGVVHRDMKPSNIMVSSDGIVKLLDLGVAKILDMTAEGELTAAGQLLGTPPYMSPEQWGEIPRDGGHEIDGRTDIYSLGVMIYQLTSGSLPFKGVSLVDFRRLHCKETAPDLNLLVNDLPPGWAKAISKAMAKDRADRYMSASEFANDLRASLINTGLLPIELLARDTTKTTPLRGTPKVEQKPHETNIIENVARDTTDKDKSDLHKTNVSTEDKTKASPKTNIIDSDVSASEVKEAKKTSLEAGLVTEEKSVEEKKDKSVSATPVAQPLPSEQKPFIHPLLLVSIVLFVILVVAVGSLFYSLRTKTRPKDNTNQQAVSSININHTDIPAPTPTPEETPFMRYHFLVGADATAKGNWKAGDTPLTPNQSVQIVLWSNENGYVYVLGYDKQKKMKAYPVGGLSAGVPINASRSVTVPINSKIKLDPQEGETVFTVIFSPAQLELPFATESLSLDSSSARKLTEDEQKKIEEMRKEAAQTNFKFTDDSETKEAVLSLNDDSKGKLVIFDIKLQLKK